MLTVTTPAGRDSNITHLSTKPLPKKGVSALKYNGKKIFSGKITVQIYIVNNNLSSVDHRHH
jgi:hypothetical protein